MNRREVGIQGEKIAREFLEKQGYYILETNYRCPEGEVDIISRDADCLVFTEVRARRSHTFGTPEESITPTKMARLRNIAARYQQEHANLPDQYQIDVIAIAMSPQGKPLTIRHIENAVGDEP